MVEILCTLGPASMNTHTISRLSELGVDLLRINLSHTQIEDLSRVIRFIKERSRVNICLDTEGAQVRTGPMADREINLREGRKVIVHAARVPGDSGNFSLYPGHVVGNLEVGDFITIDFHAVLAQVIETQQGLAVLRVLNGGQVGQNKAVTVGRDIALQPLTDKDRAAIALGREFGISHFALSFAKSAEDVDEIRRLAGEDAVIISKIESRLGVRNLRQIARRSDAILIDRGDLSREIPIERIPAAQKIITRVGKEVGTKVYVATNLLESMVHAPLPTRAEVNDIYNALQDGVDGLVLAGETAIGKYPVRCANTLVRLIKEFESERLGLDDYLDTDSPSLLPEPVGGTLIKRIIDPKDLADLPRFKRIVVDDEYLYDVEQIAHGTFSPLTGFMDHESLMCVLDRHCLPSGITWTVPVVLQIGRDDAKCLGAGDRVVLTNSEGHQHSIIDVEEVFSLDPVSIVKRWFGTESCDHPGVARVIGRADCFIAGDVSLVAKLPSAYRRYDLTPEQLRLIFAHKGWSRVVGFHSRNLVHRAHEFIQLEAIEHSFADGLLISPVVSPGKVGDFLPNVILDGYQAMLDFGFYPEGKVVLCSFTSYPRYCGPREAVFTALTRKNMGCSHFIIGRDHTGVGDFYGPNLNQEYFESLGDIGIEPVFFDPVGYDEKIDSFVSEMTAEGVQSISGTDIRAALRQNRPLPEWKMRSVVQDVARAELTAGRPIFQE